jgi:large subunit ribosomal protein L25
MAEERLSAQLRDPKKTNSRTLRQAGLVPGVYYNRKGETRWLQFEANVLHNLLKREIGLLNVEVDGETLPCIIREVQRHPVRRQILHIDLMGIAKDVKIHARVPLHTVGIPIGVKDLGGTLELVMREVEVECLPADLPTHLDIEVSALNLNEGVRASELSYKGVTMLVDPATTLVHVVPARTHIEETPVAAATTETAEPEVIRERKGEDEAEGSEKPEKKETKKEKEKK